MGKRGQKVILYVNMEHPRLREVTPADWELTAATREAERRRLADISGDECRLLHFHEIDGERLASLAPRAVVLSGFFTAFKHFAEAELAPVRALLREPGRPLLGICGSHQLLAEEYGGEIGPMGALPPGVDDPFVGFDRYLPGIDKEVGFSPVLVDNGHPLFANLGHRPHFYQSHHWEVTRAPEHFAVPAAGESCGVQAIVHRERPLVGVQFHPERYDDNHPAGRRFLANFFGEYVR